MISWVTPQRKVPWWSHLPPSSDLTEHWAQLPKEGAIFKILKASKSDSAKQTHAIFDQNFQDAAQESSRRWKNCDNENVFASCDRPYDTLQCTVGSVCFWRDVPQGRVVTNKLFEVNLSANRNVIVQKVHTVLTRACRASKSRTSSGCTAIVASRIGRPSTSRCVQNSYKEARSCSRICAHGLESLSSPLRVHTICGGIETEDNNGGRTNKSCHIIARFCLVKARWKEKSEGITEKLKHAMLHIFCVGWPTCNIAHPTTRAFTWHCLAPHLSYELRWVKILVDAWCTFTHIGKWTNGKFDKKKHDQRFLKFECFHNKRIEEKKWLVSLPRACDKLCCVIILTSWKRPDFEIHQPVAVYDACPSGAKVLHLIELQRFWGHVWVLTHERSVRQKQDMSFWKRVILKQDSMCSCNALYMCKSFRL